MYLASWQLHWAHGFSHPAATPRPHLWFYDPEMPGRSASGRASGSGSFPQNTGNCGQLFERQTHVQQIGVNDEVGAGGQ